MSFIIQQIELVSTSYSKFCNRFHIKDVETGHLIGDILEYTDNSGYFVFTHAFKNGKPEGVFFKEYLEAVNHAVKIFKNKNKFIKYNTF